MGHEKTADKDEKARTPRKKRLTLDEIEQLSDEEFDALPRAEKEQYFNFMNRENFPTPEEFCGYAEELEPPLDFGYQGISAYPRTSDLEHDTLVDASEAAREAGFTITEPDEENDRGTARVAAKDALPPGVAEAILDLMSYLWKYHFENADENDSDLEKDRVFRSQLRVNNWLFAHDTEPEGGW